jgi:phosphohistidine phosphatase
VTRRLILIRHAKSAWDDPAAEDHDRVLTDRGHNNAAQIGIWLNEQGYIPQAMLVSDAARTVQTAEHVRAALMPQPTLKRLSRLYHASPDTMLDVITRDTHDVLAVVGHNPGIAMLASGLLRQRPDHSRFADYPTAATTVIDFDGAPALGKGTCVAFMIPRDLD